ncbi:molecular chaperone DnaK [Myxococcota bacterium]|nr:molecular chaperone DnaK [Myxococcota bacterium]MBU1536132.1 molecular chaperone DnaK [Myxococcota bacterium]
MAEKVIGIDLGTTNSCVAIVEDGVSKVIPNKGSYDTTPSIVAIAETGRRLVGHMAKRQAITNASNTAFAFKRLIGRKWDSPEVKNLITTLPYDIVEGPQGDVRIMLRNAKYSISELSSFVLEEMKQVAEDYTGETISKAIITVPAYFTDSQRQATKDAGKIAGLDVIRIINEPTSAALAYGFGKDIEARIAIYDLGGGTFDISVLDIGNGVFEVITTAGDSLLGGEDFDRRIMDWLVFNFAKENHIDLRKDKMALQRLKDVSEKSKCELSAITSTEINLPFIISTGKSDPFHLQTVLSREKLEQLTTDLVDRTVRICDESLKKSGIDLSTIDQVILVGGMTRMPLVQKKVAEYFSMEPSKGVHPDEVVALGAAIQGDALLGKVEETGELLLLDVTPHSLGIKMSGGSLYKLIEANTTIPTSSKHIFTNVRDNQDAVNIIVFQGENEVADENELLGEFTLMGLRKVPKGELDIEVSFDIDANGIVKVTAKDMATSKEQAIVISATSQLTEDEIEKIIARNRSGNSAPAPSEAKAAPSQYAPSAFSSGSAASSDFSRDSATPLTQTPVAPMKPSSSFGSPAAPMAPQTTAPLGSPDGPSGNAFGDPKGTGSHATRNLTGSFGSTLGDSGMSLGMGFSSRMGSSGFGTAFGGNATSNRNAIPGGGEGVGNETIDLKSRVGKLQGDAAPGDKLKDLLDEIHILYPKVENLIKNTPYGPEALKKASTTIDKAKQAPQDDPEAVQRINMELERTLNMFRSIMMRLS